MGLFDWVQCRLALPCVPDDFEDRFGPTAEIEFQTKDTDSQYLERYVIEEDGSFTIPKGAQEEEDLVMEFYSSNVVGWSPKGFMTKDDEQYWAANYHAVWVDGKLVKLTGAITYPASDPASPHLTRAEFVKG